MLRLDKEDLSVYLAVMRFVVWFLSLLTVFCPAECGNVLVWYTEGSHWINLKIVLETLIDRGHNVTVLVPDAALFMKAKESDRFSFQHFSVSTSAQDMQDFLDELLNFSVYEMDQLNLLQIQMKFYNLASKHQDMSISYCDGILKSPELMDKLRNGKFDVVLSDPIYPCSDIVAVELNVPLVFTFRFSIAHAVERMCGQIPAPPSFVPGSMSKLTDKMSFTERIINMLFYLSQDAFCIIAWKKFDNYYTEYFGRPTSYCEMMGKADFWLIRNYWDFEFPRPFLPNFKYVGGLHCTPAKPLPKDMEEFVQSSGDDGIVVFSLGSMIDKMPKETSNMIASGLAQIPQKVLWRYGGEKPDTLGANTRIYKWIPQNDLLGHPKTRAFITHGGTNGIYEAIYHGVPMVGIPLFGDQADNLVHMKAKGAAVVMDNIKTTQPQDLVDGLNAMINDPSYKENAMRLSRIHHDRPVKPLDESVFWIEFVMRNKGAKHLRVEAHNLTWYQYHCLDVFAFLITVLTLVLYVVFKMCKFFIMRCCFSSKRKSKKE
uniref:glucuronosyltransferase n=2 Tax=Sinocyclocheilus anshuiensis TaxID=1608454 RepID=A0A671LYG3_9TELE